MDNLSLDIQPRAPVEDLVLTVSGESEDLLLTISDGHTVIYYEGEYEVTPKRREQILETEALTMKHNVTVHEIPYYETVNPYGKTFVIGE